MTKKYKHILVPLDGSKLAELALDDAFSLAQLTGAKLTLFHVLTPIEHVLAEDTKHPIFVDQQWESLKVLVQGYLNNVCKRMSCPDVEADTVIKMGYAAVTIIEYAREQPIDLIVMATHGRSGLRQWVYGSVADKVLRGANLPVLLVRAHPEQEAA